MEIKEGIFIEFEINKNSRYIGEIKETTENMAYVSFPQAPHLSNYYDKQTLMQSCVVIEQIPNYDKNIKQLKKKLRELFNKKYAECINYLNNAEFQQKNYLAMHNYADNSKSVVQEILQLQQEQENTRAKENYISKIKSATNVGNYLLEYILERSQVLNEELARNRRFDAYTSEEIEQKEKNCLNLEKQIEELNMFQLGINELQEIVQPKPKPRGRPKKNKKGDE